MVVFGNTLVLEVVDGEGEHRDVVSVNLSSGKVERMERSSSLATPAPAVATLSHLGPVVRSSVDGVRAEDWSSLLCAPERLLLEGHSGLGTRTCAVAIDSGKDVKVHFLRSGKQNLTNSFVLIIRGV